jgi:hypothetical protein
MFGSYGKGGKFLPRVFHISVRRFDAALPAPGEPLAFLVAIHEEGTGITWQRNVSLCPRKERELLILIQDLYLWSLDVALTPDKAKENLQTLGQSLYDLAIGSQGQAFLRDAQPTAVLLDVDETILNLPWELIGDSGEFKALGTPFGRLVTTRVVPRPSRDPLTEDREVKILVVANPTQDLDTTEEVQELESLRGEHGPFKVSVEILPGPEATRDRFVGAIKDQDLDIIHFAGHARLDRDEPEKSSLSLADADLTADDILDLPWKKPPYYVFNSACESGRAAGGKRLFTGESQTNGLAAAFLSAGVGAYAGFFWPVTDHGASLFAKAFYGDLFQEENVGLAFLAARKFAWRRLADKGDLTAFSAVLFGDAATEHRRNLAEAY